jgi:hypothetical protein
MDAMADDADLGQGLDVQMHELAGALTLVTHRWRLGGSSSANRDRPTREVLSKGVDRTFARGERAG